MASSRFPDARSSRPASRRASRAVSFVPPKLSAAMAYSLIASFVRFPLSACSAAFLSGIAFCSSVAPSSFARRNAVDASSESPSFARHSAACIAAVYLDSLGAASSFATTRKSSAAPLLSSSASFVCASLRVIDASFGSFCRMEFRHFFAASHSPAASRHSAWSFAAFKASASVVAAGTASP